MLIELRNLSKEYDGRKVADSINVAFESGFIAVTGKSGSGKTTLARMIIGEVSPDGGGVFLDGRSVGSLGDSVFSRVSYCPVDGCNIDALSCWDNLVAVDRDPGTVRATMEELGISSLAKLRGSKLSKGEAARLSIARALLQRGQCLILDEPTANLDPALARAVFRRLKEESAKRLVIIMSHDCDLAAEYCDLVYELRDGALSGTPARPAASPAGESGRAGGRGSALPFLKFGAKAAAAKKMPFALASAILSVSFLAGFASACLALTDRSATIQSAFSASGHDAVVCSDSRITSDILGQGAFSPDDAYREADGKGATILNLSYWSNDLSGATHERLSAVKESDARALGLLDPDFSSYSGVMKGHPNIPGSATRVEEAFYPILLSSQQFEYLADVLFQTVSVGDVLPYYFGNDYIFRAEFVYCGTFDGRFSDVPSGSMVGSCPAVIPDAALDEYVAREGIFSPSIDYALGKACEAYDSYIKANGLSEDLLTGIAGGRRLSERTFVKRSMVGLNAYREGDELPLDDTILMYSGSFPSQKGDLMIPYRKVYDSLCEGAAPKESQGFFALYPDGLPFERAESQYYAVPSFRVVGYFIVLGPAERDEQGALVYNEDGTVKRPYRSALGSPTILGDADYESARSFFVGGKRYPGIGDGQLYGSSYLARNIGLLESNAISQLYNTIPYADLLEGIRRGTPFCAAASFAVFLTGVLVCAIYSAAVGKELSTNYLRIRYWGVPAKSFRLAVLSSSLTMGAIPLAIGLSLGWAALRGMGLALASGHGVRAVPVCPVWPGFLAVAASSAALAVLMLICIGVSTRKKHG